MKLTESKIGRTSSINEGLNYHPVDRMKSLMKLFAAATNAKEALAHPL